MREVWHPRSPVARIDFIGQPGDRVVVLQFIIYALAVYRLTTMITEEAGPGWVFRKLRSLVKRKAPKKTHMDEGIECAWCMSMQIALVFSVLMYFFAGSSWFDVPVLALALSGAVVLVNQLSGK